MRVVRHMTPRSRPSMHLALILAFVVASLSMPSATATTQASGERLWVKRYNGSGNDNDIARSVATDGQRVYVTGEADVGPHDRHTTVAYDAATGGKVWVSQSDPENGPSIPRSVATDGHGVYVTGQAGGGWGADFSTVAYDATTGALLWDRTYKGRKRGKDVGRSVATDGHRVYVTGESDGPGTNADFATVAYDATTGSTVWVRRYRGLGFGIEKAASVATDGQRVYVTGGSGEIGTDYDFATVAYDATTGSTVWVERYNGPGNRNDYARSVTTDGSGVYVTGSSQGSGTGNDYATIAYDPATGRELWVSRYNGPGSDRNDVARSVATDGSGVYVTGSSYGSGTGNDYATAAYDAATGASMWVKRYSGPGNGRDSARSLATDGSGVYVTGQSFGSTTYDYATVAYDAATGTSLWVKRLNGPGNGYDDARSVATDGQRVYVTGFSSTSDMNADYATVAYQV